MAEIIWSEPALADLDAIADYIALDNPDAAMELVRNVFAHVEQVADHPRSSPKLPELRGWRYRQISEPPCRIIYRHDKQSVIILYVFRAERVLRTKILTERSKNRVK